MTQSQRPSHLSSFIQIVFHHSFVHSLQSRPQRHRDRKRIVSQNNSKSTHCPEIKNRIGKRCGVIAPTCTSTVSFIQPTDRFQQIIPFQNEDKLISNVEQQYTLQHWWSMADGFVSLLAVWSKCDCDVKC